MKLFNRIILIYTLRQGFVAVGGEGEHPMTYPFGVVMITYLASAYYYTLTYKFHWWLAEVY